MSNIIVNDAQQYYEEKWRGVKYAATEKLDVKDIAKLVRQDIASAVRAGALPDWKYSVRIERYSGGQSIRAYIVDTKGYPIMNPVKAYLRQVVPNFDALMDRDAEDKGMALGFSIEQIRPAYSSMVSLALKKLQGFLDTYNRDCSDSMVDYFQVKFYGFAVVDWDAKKLIPDEAMAAAAQAAYQGREYQ